MTRCSSLFRLYSGKMPLKESYVIWNNKGGVGKTTLTFHMATQYARRNPTETVLVIDLCPQANVSMALLTTPEQDGSLRLPSLYKEKKTVSYYFQRSFQSGPKIKASDFLTKVQEYNRQVPPNLRLLCGDMYLEWVGRHLEHRRSAPVAPDYNPWVDVTSSVRSFIEGSPNIDGVTDGASNDWVVFIDTNPAFSVCTEIALAAANKLLIPINADDFSTEAVRTMLDMVYGIRQNVDEARSDFEAYRQGMFSHKANVLNLKRPKIHLLINNRTTRYQFRSAEAYNAIAKANLKVLFQAYESHQNESKCFVQHEGQPVRDVEEFERRYFGDVQDLHTTAVLCLHTGCPLGELTGTVNFDEAGTRVKVDKELVTQYLTCLDALVNKL